MNNLFIESKINFVAFVIIIFNIITLRNIKPLHKIYIHVYIYIHTYVNVRVHICVCMEDLDINANVPET